MMIYERFSRSRLKFQKIYGWHTTKNSFLSRFVNKPRNHSNHVTSFTDRSLITQLFEVIVTITGFRMPDILKASVWETSSFQNVLFSEDHTMDKVQTSSIVIVIHHRQNPVGSICNRSTNNLFYTSSIDGAGRSGLRIESNNEWLTVTVLNHQVTLPELVNYLVGWWVNKLNTITLILQFNSQSTRDCYKHVTSLVD